MNSVCFITRATSWGGAEKHTATLINYLLFKGYNVELVSCKHNLYADYLKQWEGKPVTSFYTDLDVYDKGPSAKSSWTYFLKQIKSNLAILPKGGPYWGSFDFLSTSRKKFSKIINIEHNMTPRPPNNPVSYLKGIVWGSWRWWYRDIFTSDNRSRYTDHVIAVSDEVKRNLIKFNKYPDEKITVVGNGIDWWNFVRNKDLGAQFKNDHHLPQDCFIFGMVTRIDITKGIDLAIGSFDKLLKMDPEKKFHLVIVGTGSEMEGFERKVRSLKIDDKVTFIGFLKNTLPAFSAFDVLLMPSRMEGLPLTLLEGMSAGCIPIVSRVGGMPTVIKDDYNGFILGNNDIDNLTRAMLNIKDMANDKKLSLQNHAVERIKNEYDQNKSSEKILSVINSLK